MRSGGTGYEIVCRRQTSHELKTLCCTRYSMINFKKEYLIDSFVHYSLSSPGFLVPAFLAPFLTKCVFVLRFVLHTGVLVNWLKEYFAPCFQIMLLSL